MILVPLKVPVWESSKLPKEFKICSNKQLTIGPWLPYLRAFTKNSLKLWTLPLSLWDVCVSPTTQSLRSVFLKDMKAIPLNVIIRKNRASISVSVGGQNPNFPNVNNCQLTDTASLIYKNQSFVIFLLPWLYWAKPATPPLLLHSPFKMSISLCTSPLFPTAAVYYWLKSVLTTLTCVQVCLRQNKVIKNET